VTPPRSKFWTRPFSGLPSNVHNGVSLRWAIFLHYRAPSQLYRAGVRRAEADFSWLPDLAAQLVGLNPDAIVATASPAVSAVQRDTSSAPLVMGPTDPIGSGYKLAKPGGNVTGISIMSADLAPESLEFLRMLLPARHAQFDHKLLRPAAKVVLTAIYQGNNPAVSNCSTL
jgi:hypothetical protein